MANAQTTKISEEILQELSSTEYACSSLEKLSGGSANFIFKAALVKPLPDGTSAVAVKHGQGYVASMPDFQIPTVRCVSHSPCPVRVHGPWSMALGIEHHLTLTVPQRVEEECLKALDGLPPTTTGAYAVRAPKLYHFNPETNTQVQEYFPDSLSLKDYALKHFSSSRDPSREPLCRELGRSLGVWLRDFHAWAARPEQARLREQIKSNEPMQRIKHFVNYSNLVETVAGFPAILADARETFEQIRDATAQELDLPNLQVTHGDFWTGK